MKSTAKLLVLVMCISLLILSACSESDYSGEYGLLSLGGEALLYLDLYPDGTLETDVFGAPINGTWDVKKQTLSIHIDAYGFEETITGTINNEGITFSGMTLVKQSTLDGLGTMGDGTADNINLSTSESTTMPPSSTVASINEHVAQSNEIVPTDDPREIAEQRYKKAEELLSIGHYEEAISIYDEVAEFFDIAERKAYAQECFDYCDLYFEWSYNFRDYGVTSGLRLDRYKGFGMDTIVIPYGVCGLSGNTFSESNTDIVKIVLPETILAIPSGSLKGCTILRDINIPPSLCSLALGGTGITSLTVPATVTSIPEGAFMNCTKLETVIFEGSPSYIAGYGLFPDGVFQGCTSLKEIKIPGSFKSISSWMFSGCASLETIVLEDGIDWIGQYAFKNCSSLQNLSLPDSVKQIGQYAFEGCTALREIVWPNGTTTVPNHAFNGCTSLTKVMLPETLETIEDKAFAECVKLRDLSIPKKMRLISDDIFGDIYHAELYPYITLHVTVGTYGHRYAESRGLNYVFDQNSPESFTTGQKFSLGTYNGQELEWVVIARCGNEYLALSKYTIAQKAYNIAGESLYDDSSIKGWLENDFVNAAFDDQEKESFVRVGLLPVSYYSTFVCRNEIERNYLVDGNGVVGNTGYNLAGKAVLDHTWWLRDEYYSGKARVAAGGPDYGYVSSEPMSDIYAVRPTLWVKVDAIDNQ